MIIRVFYILCGFPKMNSFIIILSICFRNLEYAFYIIIFILEFKDNQNCYQSEYEDYLFYKRNKYSDLNNLIFDILLNNLFAN